MEPREKLVVKNLFKIFGDAPDKALALYNAGLGKQDIFDRTGQTIGVCDASFTVNEGEIFVVMGLSGSGKSTLVRLLNRLIEPTAGSISFEGTDIAAVSAQELLEIRRKHMSMVFQSFALMPHLSVVENAAFGMELSGIPRDQREARALEALDQVGLACWARNYPDELSGGMQQRVGLARALANDPTVMLMDEAFSALDPLIRTEMQDELLKLQQVHKRTVIFISHDLDEAMRIGDRIAIMEGGRVIQVGTPEDILNNPADDYVRSFFRGVDVCSVLSAGDIARRKQTRVFDRSGMGVRAALKVLSEDDRRFGYVVTNDQKVVGVVSSESLETALNAHRDRAQLQDAFLPDVPVLRFDTPLSELYGPVAQTPCGVPIVDDDGRYMGVVTKTTLLETLNQRDEAVSETPVHA